MSPWSCCSPSCPKCECDYKHIKETTWACCIPNMPTNVYMILKRQRDYLAMVHSSFTHTLQEPIMTYMFWSLASPFIHLSYNSSTVTTILCAVPKEPVSTRLCSVPREPISACLCTVSRQPMTTPLCTLPRKNEFYFKVSFTQIRKYWSVSFECCVHANVRKYQSDWRSL